MVNLPQSPGEPVLIVAERRRVPRDLPLPEVTEGNDNEDWDLWEASVSQQTSQPLPAAPPPRELPPKVPDIAMDMTDPFASVHKRSG